jgi:Gpi18-like mannosyltransferase
MIRHILCIIAIALCMKVVYVLFSVVYTQGTNEKTNLSNRNSVLKVFMKNDTYWYMKIATRGYQKITPEQLGGFNGQTWVQSYYAFFPLYPLTVGSTMKFLNIRFSESAFAYSVILSILAFILFYFFSKTYTGNEKTAFWSTVILIVFPFHYYFSMFYTESLYLLLLLSGFLAVHYKKHLIIAISLGLLVLTRPNGILMTIPLFIYYFEKHYSLNLKDIINRPWKDYLPLLVFLSAPVVMTAYCLFLKDMTGDYFAFVTAQKGWHAKSTLPWIPLKKMTTTDEYFRAAYMGVFGLISVIFWRKIPISMQALIWINLLLPLTANSVTRPRYISCIFIFYILFAIWTTKWKWPYKFSLAGILLAAQLVTFSFWITSSQFSY